MVLCKVANMPSFSIFLFVAHVLCITVQSQLQFDNGGFLNINCGLASDQSYVDDTTSLVYVSDNRFVETGEIYNISNAYINPSVDKLYLSLRSFPNGNRNCYVLESTIPSDRYLLRVGFLYGNYDGLNSESTNSGLSFDLYIGVNLWDTVNISDASLEYQYELITVASNNFMSICLINTGSGTPFISFIERRHLTSTMYNVTANSSQSLKLSNRYYSTSNTDPIIRYPNDTYDRIWQPWSSGGWKPYYNSLKDMQTSLFEVPIYVLQHAIVNGSTGNIYFSRSYPQIEKRYVFLHIAEIGGSLPNGPRIFDIYVDNTLLAGSFSVVYKHSNTVYTPEPSAAQGFEVFMKATSNSAYGPILNAWEVYSLVTETEVATHDEDSSAIGKIRKNYSVLKNWMGDPCSPKNYSWDGVGCNYTGSTPIIISLNLSSSGLIGSISDSFSSLKSIQILDLSNNQLSGDVPDSLGNLSSLRVLNLTGNCLNKVPSALTQKSANGTLSLRFDRQTRCENPNNSKKRIIVISAVVILLSVIIVAMVVGFIMCIHKRKREARLSSNDDVEITLQIVARQFTPKELIAATNNLNQVIGKGGFGTVYYGKLDDGTEVAVKKRQDSSSQNVDEFLSEALHLARTHHKYLVKMIGYCKDTNFVALVFECMSQGTLQEHLRGEASNLNPLSWRKRLQIALESALGLEYLHKGCSPPIIHRDVKTNNILLNADLQAKIADFGISKAFDHDDETHKTTRIIGTLGYLDPEYHGTGMLTEKSDVYSFGVVLLEIITGQPSIIVNDEARVHISRWVLKILYKGNETIDFALRGESLQSDLPEENISEVADKAMQGKYKMNSLKKAVELALQCVADDTASRPSMSEVVSKLKKCIKLEYAESTIPSPHDSMEVPLTSEEILS